MNNWEKNKLKETGIEREIDLKYAFVCVCEFECR